MGNIMNRCKHEVISQILQSGLQSGGATKKTLFEKDANLNYNVGNNILNILIEMKLISSDKVGRRGAKYKTTDRGRLWLVYFHRMDNYLL